MTDPEEWQRLALWVAKPYAGRQDADDIRQEALIGAWVSMQKVAALGIGCAPNQAAVKGAKWAVADYLKRGRRGRHARLDPLEVISLEELGHDPIGAPIEDDVLEDVWRGQFRALCRRVLMPTEWEMVERFYWRGQDRPAIAAAMGTTRKQVERGLRRARARIKENME